MAFNDLLKQLGGVGRFQQIQVTLVILPLLMTASHNMLQNFVAAIPTHHCRQPAHANLSEDGQLEAWLPRDGQGQPASCLRFTTPQWGPPFPNGTEANRTAATEPCTEGWIYDNSTFPSTIVTEWDLVCSYRALRQLAQSLYMAGVLLGAMVFGYLADRSSEDPPPRTSPRASTPPPTQPGPWSSLLHRLGRRKVLILTCLQLAVAGTCAAFAPNFHIFCAFRFLSGMSVAGITLNSVTLNMEWMPIHTRAYLSTMTGYVYSLGQIVLAGLAYAMPHWRHLQLLVSVPFFAFFIYCWFATSFAYYGVAMDLQGFGVSIYLIQIIFGAVDLPAKLVGFLITNFVGRRPAQMASLLLAGICILINGVVPKVQTTVRTFLAVLGKGCLAASFNGMLLYTGELYPTVIRQTGLGMGSTMARVGSIISPLVSMTAELHPSVPFFIFGIVAMAASIVTLLLPETLGRPLPDTVQDMENRRGRKLQEEQQKQMVPLQSSAQKRID
ncbi:solute carrier family 22 member 6 isoform X5 [Saccopteryx leptura]|uniref:solute carrier family 22 member 6 isoform X5 n=1 Tax=Saccopteryx leptura TaxID=249018 RepID=UPI00339D21F2